MSSTHSPRRIACLQPSATVILAALGELDRVVACTTYCADVVPEITGSGRTILEDSWTADARQIAAVQPDLVIAAVPYQEKAVIEILKAGVRFLGLAPKCLADIYTDIATIAGTVGASARGEDLVAYMQGRIEEVHSRTLGLARPKVFCEEWGKPIIASQGWVAELIEAAGGDVVAKAGQHLSPEAIIDLAPDVIIAAWCGAGDRVPLKKIVATRGWENLPAVLSGRVFCVRDEFLNTPAPSLLRGLDALAWALHPELFPWPEGLPAITPMATSTVPDSPC